MNKVLQLAWNSFSQEKDYKKAITLSRRARSSHKESFLPYYIEGLSLQYVGRYNDALAILKKANNKFKKNPNLLAALGSVLIDLHRIDEGKNSLEAAIELDNELPLAWANLSNVYYQQSYYPLSIMAAEKALKKAPNDIGPTVNLINSYKEIGKVQDALNECRKTLQIYPENKSLWASYLFISLFSEDFEPTEYKNNAKKFAKILRDEINVKPYTKIHEPNILRIGIMSNDLYNHACVYFLLPFIANIDRENVDVVLFKLNSKEDHVTLKFKYLANSFIDVSAMEDIEIIETVRKENLDILLDVGGYTGKPPLQYMAHRLAEIQVSWLGYPASSGMEEIDLRISDSYCDTLDCEKNYTEKNIYAPEVFCIYSPLVAYPLRSYEKKYFITDPPFERNGYITFGSCNNLAKISDRTISLWKRVLDELPTARLLIEAPNLTNEMVKGHMIDRLKLHEVDLDRLEMISRDGANQYITYNKIDIVLDSVPMTGGTTTCDALWMGVPVITIAGKYFHTRISSSLLRAVGLSALVCIDDAQYVKQAVILASDLINLKKIRQELRVNMENSSILKHKEFSDWFIKTARKYTNKKIIEEATLEAETKEESIFFNGRSHSWSSLQSAMLLLLSNKRVDELTSLLENISAKWPRNWIVCLMLSEIDYIKGKPDASIEKLSEAIVLNPNSIELLKFMYERMNLMQLNTEEIKKFIQFKFKMTDREFNEISINTVEHVIMTGN